MGENRIPDPIDPIEPEDPIDAEADKDPEFVQEVAKMCMDAGGYLLFAGIITGERDKRGNPVIQFRYKRLNFSFDDTEMAINQLKKHFKEDVLEQLE